MVVDGSMEKSAGEHLFIKIAEKHIWGKSDQIKWGKMDQWSYFESIAVH